MVFSVNSFVVLRHNFVILKKVVWPFRYIFLSSGSALVIVDYYHTCINWRYNTYWRMSLWNRSADTRTYLAILSYLSWTQTENMALWRKHERKTLWVSSESQEDCRIYRSHWFDSLTMHDQQGTQQQQQIHFNFYPYTLLETFQPRLH